MDEPSNSLEGVVPEPAVPAAAVPDEAKPATEPAVAAKPKRRVGRLILISVLSLALAAAIGILVYGYLKLQDANALIKQQQQQLDDQKKLIDEKQTFGAAMNDLMSTVVKFNGVPMGALVPVPTYTALAERAWVNRRDATAVNHDIDMVHKANDALNTLLATAATEIASNATGSASEATIDQLGHGFVSSVFESIQASCGAEALACVFSDTPYQVHFDAAGNAQPWVNDFIRTGIAYHEFAHVLQFTNPEPTKPAVAAFGGDVETMADCFALTYVPGWSLQQRVFVSTYQYYDVSLGYGYTCNDGQKQVIRDWYEHLGFQEKPISQ